MMHFQLVHLLRLIMSRWTQWEKRRAQLIRQFNHTKTSLLPPSKETRIRRLKIMRTTTMGYASQSQNLDLKTQKQPEIGKLFNCHVLNLRKWRKHLCNCQMKPLRSRFANLTPELAINMKLQPDACSSCFLHYYTSLALFSLSCGSSCCI